jgi:organic hydroperoxide reductase OsmC/OhrA
VADHLHSYSTRIAWSGNTGAGYAAYDRRHVAEVPPGGLAVPMSSDATFGGDAALPNPEQLLALAASSCQLLSFLAVAARARLEVVHYTDDAVGEMPEVTGPTGLTCIRLRPEITVTDRPVSGTGTVTEDRVRHLCEVAHRECYIANSLRTEVVVEPRITVVPAGREGTDANR